ncbi:MAG TPA: PPOX class F420-dependent oxidoreductase [Acidimicrobiales bacterium]|nr:PPOX class F420-dependent oxidoreductase [Acidimicrobiales bacterium]
MAKPIATNRIVDRTALDEFIRDRHHGVLLTRRADGWPQSSLVTVGLGDHGDVLVATYPERAKVANLRRDARASIVVMSDSFGGEWVQVDGMATVFDAPDAVDGLVEYFRNISGEHSDWDEYRQAMVDQGKSLIRLTIERWGPIAKGGFPARLVDT